MESCFKYCALFARLNVQQSEYVSLRCKFLVFSVRKGHSAPLDCSNVGVGVFVEW